MNHDNKSLEKLKDCFNQSAFFSTSISSQDQFHDTTSRTSNNLFRISSRFTDQPKVYLQKVKFKRQEASKKCLEALKRNIRAKSCLERTQREASIFRYDFIKLYHTKKFKMDQKSLLTDHKMDNDLNFRQTINNIRRKRAQNELNQSILKSKRQQKVQSLQQKSKDQKLSLKQALKSTQQKIRDRIFENVEKIRKQRYDYEIRHKNLSQLATTRAKFNYLSKINDEMQTIKQFQQRIEQFHITESRKEPQQLYSNTFTSGFY